MEVSGGRMVERKTDLRSSDGSRRKRLLSGSLVSRTRKLFSANSLPYRSYSPVFSRPSTIVQNREMAFVLASPVVTRLSLNIITNCNALSTTKRSALTGVKM